MSSAKDLADALLKMIGENADAEAISQYLDTGFPPLNKIVSGRYDGGLPYGRLYEMFGDSSTGKTALATKWMVEAQRLGGVAGFMDWERSFNIDLAKHFGLRDERPFWIYKKPKTWEEGNVIATKACAAIRAAKVIPDSAPILMVFDSIAAALPQSMAEKEISEYNMNDTTALARVTSTTLKAQAQYAEEFNAIFLYLNQVRLKPGVVYGDPRTTPGGRAMEYFASARLSLTREKIMGKVEGEKDKQFLGQNIGIKCTKSKFTKPFQETDMLMTFSDDGAATFDMHSSLLAFLVKKDLVKMNGNRVDWEGKSLYPKEVAERLRADPAGFDKLVALLPKVVPEVEETAEA